MTSGRELFIQEIWANAHETRESLCQFLFAGHLGLSPSISSQFTLLQPKMAKKYEKTYF